MFSSQSFENRKHIHLFYKSVDRSIMSVFYNGRQWSQYTNQDT